MTYNFREFVGIYIAMIVVQLLLGVWTLSAYTNYYANDELFDNNYSYDLTVTGSNQTIANLSNVLRYEVMASDATFSDFVPMGNTIGITLKNGDFDPFYEEFLRDLYEDEAISYTLTPKYVYHSEIQGEIILSSVLIGIVAFLMGCAILSVIYSVRTNHYKFQYGIYMTFGADKKMLGSIAMNELIAVGAITLIPSAILSYLLTLIVYRGSGVRIVLSVPQLLIYILLSVAVILVSAGASLGGLFLKPPVSLITTADNSNFVSSPRRSFNLFAKNMPLHYETFSAWRFRKYIARLVLGAVIFSVIFVTGVYCANMIRTENDAPSEELVISYRFSTMVNDSRLEANSDARYIIPELVNIENVEKATIEQSKSFANRVDHLLVKPGTEYGGTGFTVASLNEADGYTRATNNCRYVCVDELALAIYESLYDVEYLDGYDAESLLNDEGLIIVSEGLYGAKRFDFEPGDNVVVADMTSIDTQLPVVSDPLELLGHQITHCSFKYTEYTVGAVINDTDATESIIIGMNPDTYHKTTGEKRAISEIKVYVSSNVSLEEISALRREVEELMSSYPSWKVKTTDAAVYAIVDDRLNLPGLLYLMSALVLMISPVVWIFSQVMFYKKREPEFRTLGHIGATMKEILGIHIVSGCIIFVVGFIANFILSRLLCYIIYRIFTGFLPKLGLLGMSVSFDTFVPVSTVLLCAAVSAICGLISALIPFILYKNKLNREIKSVEAINTDIQR